MFALAVVAVVRVFVMAVVAVAVEILASMDSTVRPRLEYMVRWPVWEGTRLSAEPSQHVGQSP